MSYKEVLDSFRGRKILVIGDLMLDHYVIGKVDRISPEAPVPVLEAVSEEYRLGGAANVALNLEALGAEPILVGCIGSDISGEIVQRLLAEKNIPTDSILVSVNRRTTLKTRMSAGNQQILRIDYEDKDDISGYCLNDLKNKLIMAMRDAEAIVVEDYNKGLLCPEMISLIFSEAKVRKIPVAVDPKYKNFFAYIGANIFKPNYQEMQKNLGKEFSNDDEFYAAAFELRKTMQAEYLVLTRGAKGLYIFSNDFQPEHIPTFAKDVFDVTGAGDTVISVLSLAFASGCKISQAALLANHAAGVVCGKKGTAVANAVEILASMESHS